MKPRVKRSSESVAQYQKIIFQENSGTSFVIGYWNYDISNDRVYANALVALVFNISPTLVERGAPLDLFLANIHPNDRKHAEQTIKHRTETGVFREIEYRVRSADGVTRRIIDRSCTELDKSGRPQQSNGILIDITANCRKAGKTPPASCHADHPIERAAEHCLAAHEAIRQLPEPLLQNMCDMLLLEIGRRLSTITDERHEDMR